MSLHESHACHLAVATDGAKRGGQRQNGNSENIGDHIWSVARPGIDGDTQRKKEGSNGTTRKIRGVLSGRLGESATAAEAALFAIFAILRKVQAQQLLGY
eukprot:1584467-Pleurochrysis_carterae.AAC.3